MSQNRLDRLFEGERASLAKLDQMVKDEENKIAELRQSVRHKTPFESQKLYLNFFLFF